MNPVISLEPGAHRRTGRGGGGGGGGRGGSCPPNSGSLSTYIRAESMDPGKYHRRINLYMPDAVLPGILIYLLCMITVCKYFWLTIQTDRQADLYTIFRAKDAWSRSCASAYYYCVQHVAHRMLPNTLWKSSYFWSLNVGISDMVVFIVSLGHLISWSLCLLHLKYSVFFLLIFKHCSSIALLHSLRFLYTSSSSATQPDRCLLTANNGRLFINTRNACGPL